MTEAARLVNKRTNSSLLSSAVLVVVISGASRSGKSRLSSFLQSAFHNTISGCMVVGQDSFWTGPVQVSLHGRGGNKNNSSATARVDSEEEYECTDWDRFVGVVDDSVNHLQKRCQNKGEEEQGRRAVALLLIEGFQVLYDRRLVARSDLAYHLDISKDECLKRRCMGPRCPVGNPNPVSYEYGHTILWPTHVAYEKNVVGPLGDRVRHWDSPGDLTSFDALAAQVVEDIERHLDQKCREKIKRHAVSTTIEAKCIRIPFSAAKEVDVYAQLRHNFQKWKATTDAGVPVPRIPVVLVSTGSFNPVHVQHIQMFQSAKYQLQHQGYDVLAGYLSPSQDLYVLGKLPSNEVLSAHHRLALIDVATRDCHWLASHPWEQAQQGGFVDFGPVVMELTKQIHTAMGTTDIQVRYLCGMDHAQRCGLLHSRLGSRLGTVIMSRPADDHDGPALQGIDDLTAKEQEEFSKKRNILFVKAPMEDEEARATAGTGTLVSSTTASSTAIRNALLCLTTEGDDGPRRTAAQKVLAQYLDPMVQNYLRDHANELGGIFSQCHLLP